MSKQFYIDGERIDEKECSKNRCCCPIIQYATQNKIKMRVNFIAKKHVEKIGFYGAQDNDILTAKIYTECQKCK
jgi:hypothetical protein